VESTVKRVCEAGVEDGTTLVDTHWGGGLGLRTRQSNDGALSVGLWQARRILHAELAAFDVLNVAENWALSCELWTRKTSLVNGVALVSADGGGSLGIGAWEDDDHALVLGGELDTWMLCAVLDALHILVVADGEFLVQMLGAC
jgi:hypothetical protein